ncbi:MAG: hypothetical protein PHV06_10685, partial [bacterium]|nr:hypothetical protein [bacterium]
MKKSFLLFLLFLLIPVITSASILPPVEEGTTILPEEPGDSVIEVSEPDTYTPAILETEKTPPTMIDNAVIGTEPVLTPDVAPVNQGLIPTIDVYKDAKIDLEGHKSVSMGFSGKSYPNDPETETYSEMLIDQELKLTLKGYYADRLTININYDDTQEEVFVPERDISIVYKGKNEEFVQEVAAGNTNLMIPNTRFVSFSQTMFGIRAHLYLANPPLIPGELHFYPMLGISENKTAEAAFVGNVTENKLNIYDQNFSKNTYFYILKSSGTGLFPEGQRMVSGKIKVYLDDANNSNNDENTITCGPGSSKGTQQWHFDPMFSGVDFYVNTSEGIITFIRSIPNESRVITAFELENLSTGETTAYGNIYNMFPDQDGDGLLLEDPSAGFDNDDDGLIDEDGFSGVDGLPGGDDDGDGQIDEDPGDDWIDDNIFQPD